jgi:AcrR family transcriptional regulator
MARRAPEVPPVEPPVVEPAGPASATDGARRAEILETAAALIASSGLRTTLKDIADASGILPGSLYHHFESKDAIFVELIEAYRADLELIAEEAAAQLALIPDRPTEERLASLADRLARCAVRHRAALLLTFYEPPSGAGDQLTRLPRGTPAAIEAAALATLRAGRRRGDVRAGLDLETLADRFCQAMLHISLGVLRDVPGAARVPEIRSQILFRGIATRPAPHRTLDRSSAMRAAQRTVASWDVGDGAEDERFAALRSVARAEFGRRGYEATTIRDIAAAAGLSTGSVYRLVGSKDELLATIMQSFVTKVRTAWRDVLASGSTAVEKLDALMWLDINVVDRFSDEFNIQVAWLRDSPPTTSNLGSSFTARLRDLKSLLADGTRSGQIRIEGASADLRAWSLFELLWLPENIVRDLGPRDAHRFARDTVLRGAAAPA